MSLIQRKMALEERWVLRNRWPWLPTTRLMVINKWRKWPRRWKTNLMLNLPGNNQVLSTTGTSSLPAQLFQVAQSRTLQYYLHIVHLIDVRNTLLASIVGDTRLLKIVACLAPHWNVGYISSWLRHHFRLHMYLWKFCWKFCITKWDSVTCWCIWDLSSTL